MKALAVLFAGSALALAANATVMTGGSFNNALATTEIAQSGILQKFDSTLGVLTGISLKMNGRVVTDFSITNNAVNTQNIRATYSVDLFFGSDASFLDAAIAGVNPVVAIAGDTGVQSYLAGQTKSFGPDDISNSFVFASSNASILAQLQAAGGGTFKLTCESLSGFGTIGGGGNVGTDQRTKASCGAELEYTYETRQVPEPDALALVGLALAGIALVRRRKA